MHEGPFARFALLLLVCARVGAVFVRPKPPVLIACAVVGIDRLLEPFEDAADRAAQTLAAELCPQEPPA